MVERWSSIHDGMDRWEEGRVGKSVRYLLLFLLGRSREKKKILPSQSSNDLV